MQTTSDWCAIRLVTYLSQAADFLGQWGESCPCEHHNDGPQLVKKLSGQRVRVGRQSEGSTCPFRCCRAAELASGKALTLLTALVESQQSKFLKCVATAPVAHQSALTGAWYTATSKLLGSLFQLQIHIAWFITRLCMFVCCNFFLVLVLVALNSNQYIPYLIFIGQNFFSTWHLGVLIPISFVWTFAQPPPWHSSNHASGHISAKLSYWQQLPWVLCPHLSSGDKYWLLIAQWTWCEMTMTTQHYNYNILLSLILMINNFGKPSPSW